MTDRDELKELRASARTLIRAIDEMHRRGETFTAGVSVATAAVRRLLAPTWPKDHGDGEQGNKTDGS